MAAKEYNMDRRTVYTRMKKQNMNLEEALTFPLRKNLEVTVEGVTYKSLRKACSVYDVNYSTVYNRVRYEGMQAEEAILMELNHKKEGDLHEKQKKDFCKNDRKQRRKENSGIS